MLMYAMGNLHNQRHNLCCVSFCNIAIFTAHRLRQLQVNKATIQDQSLRNSLLAQMMQVI